MQRRRLLGWTCSQGKTGRRRDLRYLGCIGNFALTPTVGGPCCLLGDKCHGPRS